jgi:hypothetical protein
MVLIGFDEMLHQSRRMVAISQSLVALIVSRVVQLYKMESDNWSSRRPSQYMCKMACFFRNQKALEEKHAH